MSEARGVSVLLLQPIAGRIAAVGGNAADAERDVLEIDGRFLDVPFSTAEPTTAAFLGAQAERMRSRVVSAESFVERARSVIARSLPNGPLEVDELAKRLGTSERTLHRRLRADGTSHRELVVEVRKARALELLAQRDLSLIEVAHELGFADQASFQHAFKRWTGQAPGAYRKRT